VRGAITQSLAAILEATERARQELADLQAQADNAEQAQPAKMEQPKPAHKTTKRSGGKIDNARLLDAWRETPAMADSSLAAMFGVSRQAIAQRRQALEAAGAIKRNGHGVEISQGV